jgi:hypothetical protein
MKLFYTLALCVCALAAAVSPQLKQVNTVYILSMTSGMDQFLANQLTRLGVFQVVADPQKADAIFTDRLGEPFESKLNDLYPPPPPPEAPKKEADDTKSDKHDAHDAKDMGGGASVRLGSSSSRGKGNLFLVDRRTRSVLWSIYEPPKDSTPGELSKTATKVVKRLQSDLSDKKPGGE